MAVIGASRVVAGAVLAVAGYYAVWGGEYSAWDLRRLRLDQESAQERLAESERQVDSLRHLARQLDQDPATIEAVARERFGMIRDGELLYRFVPVSPEPAPAPAATRITARTP
jgi:cell division protein FtsB